MNIFEAKKQAFQMVEADLKAIQANIPGIIQNDPNLYKGLNTLVSNGKGNFQTAQFKVGGFTFDSDAVIEGAKLQELKNSVAAAVKAQAAKVAPNTQNSSSESKEQPTEVTQSDAKGDQVSANKADVLECGLTNLDKVIATMNKADGDVVKGLSTLVDQLKVASSTAFSKESVFAIKDAVDHKGNVIGLSDTTKQFVSGIQDTSHKAAVKAHLVDVLKSFSTTGITLDQLGLKAEVLAVIDAQKQAGGNGTEVKVGGVNKEFQVVLNITSGATSSTYNTKVDALKEHQAIVLDYTVANELSGKGCAQKAADFEAAAGKGFGELTQKYPNIFNATTTAKLHTQEALTVGFKLCGDNQPTEGRVLLSAEWKPLPAAGIPTELESFANATLNVTKANKASFLTDMEGFFKTVHLEAQDDQSFLYDISSNGKHIDVVSAGNFVPLYHADVKDADFII